jgi:hypothetical protein
VNKQAPTMSNLNFITLMMLIASAIGYFAGWPDWQHLCLAGAVAATVLDAFLEDWKGYMIEGT